MRNLEKNSSRKDDARSLYENSLLSNREIAKEIGCSEKSVRNWIDQGKWERKSASAADQVRTADVAEPVAGRSATEIAKDFCGTVDVLRAELDTVIRNLRLIQEISEADIDGDSEKVKDARRRLLAKVLDLPALVKSANDLAAALSRLKDVGPGKKEQRLNDAEKSASAGRFAVPPPPTQRLQ